MDRKTKTDLRQRLRDELFQGTPRAQRAQRFSAQIMGLVHDFVPSHRDTMHALSEHLMLVAFDQDIELISVAPERDEMAKQLLEVIHADITLEPMTYKKF